MANEKLYEVMEQALRGVPKVPPDGFFSRLGKMEREHADMLALLREVSKRIPNSEAGAFWGEQVDGCAVCGHDPEWPEAKATHLPGCKLAALLKSIDGEAA